MKRLISVDATCEMSNSLIHFEIPYYSEIHKIEYCYHTNRYSALVLEDDSLGIKSFKNQKRIETYQSISWNQELDGSTGTKLIIVSRTDDRNRDYGDVYLLKKIVEPRDDLDRAQDIFEFNLEKENEEDINKFDIPF